jgi:hypothetical protein
MSEAVESTPQSRYYAVKLAHDLNAERLRELEAKAVSHLLSEDELDEQGRLERQVQNQGRVLEVLAREMVLEQDKLNIEMVVSRWSDLVEAKRQAYQHVAQSLADLEAAIDALWAVHDRQEQEVRALPSLIQERLAFPDAGTQAQRLVARLPGGLGGLIGGPIGLTKGQFDQVVDVDPGTKELNPRMIQRFLEENARWIQPKF